MANEPTEEQSAEKSVEKSTARRSRRRPNRSGSPSETPAENQQDRKPASLSSDNPASGKPGDRPSESAADRTPVSRPSDSQTDRKPADRPAESPAARSAAPRSSENRTDHKPTGRPMKKPASRKLTDRPSDRRPAPRPSDSPADRKPTFRTTDMSSFRSSAPRPSEKTADRKPSSRWTLRDYLLQLSVVIVGIMVTFIGSAQIDRWRQAHQVRATMQLVYEELKADRESLVSICSSLDFDRRGMLLIQKHGDYKRAPIDSLAKYQFLLGQMRSFDVRTDALEVLKVSGVISSVGDKQLLLDVLECYSQMERFAGSVVKYNSQKLSSLNHLFANGLDGALRGPDVQENWKAMMSDPMCAAFIGTMSNFFGEKLITGGSVARVDRVLVLLNEKYDFE